LRQAEVSERLGEVPEQLAAAADLLGVRRSASTGGFDPLLRCCARLAAIVEPYRDKV
jgi:hypothetical protein